MSIIPRKNARYSTEVALFDATDLTVGLIESVVEVHDAKTVGAVHIIKRAAHGAAALGQVENQLTDLVPGSAAKIGYIIDRGTLALGDLVDDGITKLRRIR